MRNCLSTVTGYPESRSTSLYTVADTFRALGAAFHTAPTPKVKVSEFRDPKLTIPTGPGVLVNTKKTSDGLIQCISTMQVPGELCQNISYTQSLIAIKQILRIFYYSMLLTCQRGVFLTNHGQKGWLNLEDATRAPRPFFPSLQPNSAKVKGCFYSSLVQQQVFEIGQKSSENVTYTDTFACYTLMSKEQSTNTMCV